jgi:SpoVK/Ycf46/Vps4 family AAA+-type ATPase
MSSRFWFSGKRMSDAFINNRDYLETELARLDLLIRGEVVRFRQRSREEQMDGFRGVFISESEVDQLLRAADQEQSPDEELKRLRDQAGTLRDQIRQRRQAASEKGTYLSLAHLAHIFHLSPVEEDLILICLAPEIDLKYERLYAYLQDDLTRRLPSVGLALKLLCNSTAESDQARALFAPQSVTFRAQLLHLQVAYDASSLGSGLKLDERITRFLLGTGGVEKELSPCIKPLPSPVEFHALRWPDSLKTDLLNLTRDYLQSEPKQFRKLIYNFHGPAGTGRKTLAAALCRQSGIPSIVVDVGQVLRQPNFEDAIRKVFREGVLQPAAIFLEHFDLLLADDDDSVSRRQQLFASLEEFSWLTFLSTEKAWEPGRLPGEHLYLGVELPAPGMQERVDLWTAVADSRDAFAADVSWEELAIKFRFTPGQMSDALGVARNRARLRGSENEVVTTDDLYRGCRAQSNKKLGSSARKLVVRHSWGDIILPQKELTQLREVCAHLKYRQKVYGEWGFGSKVSSSPGLCVFFYGPSGTGKTTAVEILADELQLEAYKIDLSTVVSKYIGETEKNLSAVFHEAETSNAILFFDEADALFGKRSEVKDAHDRYANIEINYLLQRMEEFEGLVILATNLRKNIDEAFFRRMHFAIEFPFPDETYRYQIWKRHFPPSAPVADDIDFNFLASRLNVTGGNIKNIVINAAFLAAANSGVIDMKHVVRAAKREYEKIGRLCTAAEFTPYHQMIDH